MHLRVAVLRTSSFCKIQNEYSTSHSQKLPRTEHGRMSALQRMRQGELTYGLAACTVFVTVLSNVRQLFSIKAPHAALRPIPSRQQHTRSIAREFTQEP